MLIRQSNLLIKLRGFLILTTNSYSYSYSYLEIEIQNYTIKIHTSQIYLGKTALKSKQSLFLNQSYIPWSLEASLMIACISEKVAVSFRFNNIISPIDQNSTTTTNNGNA